MKTRAKGYAPARILTPDILYRNLVLKILKKNGHPYNPLAPILESK